MQPLELKAARQELGMTQQELAEALGLTPQFIGMMERGVRPIERRTVLALRYLADHPEARGGHKKAGF